MSAPGIYQIKNLNTGYRYVGRSVNVPQRLRAHRCELRRDNHYNRQLQAAFNTGDKLVFTAVEWTHEHLLKEREQVYMDAWKGQLYNTADSSAGGYGPLTPEIQQHLMTRRNGGGWNKGITGQYHASELTRQRQSAAMMGKSTAWLTGKPRSAASCAKQSATMMGHTVPVETRAKISAAKIQHHRRLREVA